MNIPVLLYISFWLLVPLAVLYWGGRQMGWWGPRSSTRIHTLRIRVIWSSHQRLIRELGLPRDEARENFIRDVSKMAATEAGLLFDRHVPVEEREHR